jgi:hypothetical protein
MNSNAKMSALGLVVALLASCTPALQTTPPAATAPPAEATAPTPAPSAAPAPEAAASAPEPAVPTSGEPAGATDAPDWLVDEQGKEYRVLNYPKASQHRKLENGRVRLAGGGSFELLGEDDLHLALKIYRTEERTDNRPAIMTAVTPEKLAAAEKAYPAAPPPSDRLKLRPFDRGLPTRGLWRNGFDVVDMNGDGHLDLVHGPPRKGGDQLRIFLGNGAGQWRPWPTKVPAGLLDYGDVKVADVNGDGVLDVVAGVHLRGVLALFGDGAGTFTPIADGSGLEFRVPVIGDPAPQFSTRRIEVVDWDGDGRKDVLAFSEGPTAAFSASRSIETDPELVRRSVEFAKRGLWIFRNLGGDRWQPVSPPPEAANLFGDDMVVADLDGDGASDLLLSTSLMGHEELIFLNDRAGGSVVGPKLETRPRGYVRAVAVGDWNGDKRIDLALSYVNFELGVSRVGIDLYFAGASGEWRRQGLFARSERLFLGALESGDVDGDGALDLAALDVDGGLLLFLGDGKGGFTLENTPEAQQPRGKCRGYGLRFEDLNGDGAEELFATYADEPQPLYEPDRCLGTGGVAVWTGAPAN